jgi:hypothetical protein
VSANKKKSNAAKEGRTSSDSTFLDRDETLEALVAELVTLSSESKTLKASLQTVQDIGSRVGLVCDQLSDFVASMGGAAQVLKSIGDQSVGELSSARTSLEKAQAALTDLETVRDIDFIREGVLSLEDELVKINEQLPTISDSIGKPSEGEGSVHVSLLKLSRDLYRWNSAEEEARAEILALKKSVETKMEEANQQIAAMASDHEAQLKALIEAASKQRSSLASAHEVQLKAILRSQVTGIIGFTIVVAVMVVLYMLK